MKFPLDKIEEICLSHFMGEHTETIESWKKRVSENCELAKNPTKAKKIPSVYQKCPNKLWTEKKARRKQAFIREVLKLPVPDRLDDFMKVYHDYDAKIAEAASSPGYKTMQQQNAEEEEKEQQRIKEHQEKQEKEISTNIQKLRKKFDDETIAIIYPEAKEIFNKKDKKPLGVV